jgi:hypothetical protein
MVTSRPARHLSPASCESTLTADSHRPGQLLPQPIHLAAWQHVFDQSVRDCMRMSDSGLDWVSLTVIHCPMSVAGRLTWCRLHRDGGKDAKARQDLWCRLVLDGTIGASNNPVSWDFKSGTLPKTPVWADFVGDGVKPPEQGFPPVAREGSTQNEGADGSVVSATALQRELAADRATALQHQVQMQQQMQAMMMQMQQMGAGAGAAGMQQQQQLLLDGQRRKQQAEIAHQQARQRRIDQIFPARVTPVAGGGAAAVGGGAAAGAGAAAAADVAAVMANPAVVAAIAAAMAAAAREGDH